MCVCVQQNFSIYAEKNFRLHEFHTHAQFIYYNFQMISTIACVPFGLRIALQRSSCYCCCCWVITAIPNHISGEFIQIFLSLTKHSNYIKCGRWKGWQHEFRFQAKMKNWKQYNFPCCVTGGDADCDLNCLEILFCVFSGIFHLQVSWKDFIEKFQGLSWNLLAI